MGTTLASLSLSGNFPVAKLLFIRASMLNDNRLATNFIIVGPIPSIPIALMESKATIDADICSRTILGILKYISFGTLSFTKFVRLNLRLAFLIKFFVLLPYFLYPGHKCLRLQASRFIRLRAI